MKNQLITLVIGTALILAVGYSVPNYAADCRKPNGNTKKCHNPSDEVVSCNGYTEDTCKGAIYHIADFPDGTESSDNGGRTDEKSTPCYLYTSCIWNKTTKKCGNSDTSSQLTPKAKTIARAEYAEDDECNPDKFTR